MNNPDKQVGAEDRQAPRLPWRALLCVTVVLWLFFTICHASAEAHIQRFSDA
jgi:hypothetical protein